MYGDPEHPNRVTRQVHSPPYTDEDQALLSALALHEAGQCPGCKQPIVEAWHSEMEGWYDAPLTVVCHSCSARDGDEVAYHFPRHTRPASKGPLPPFEIGKTTTAATPPDTQPGA